MKRIAMGVFALTMALGFAGAAQSQVICSKTNNKGKVKFKMRDVCKSNEVLEQDLSTVADVADIPVVPADIVTESDLPVAPGLLATLGDVAAVPRTRVYAYRAGITDFVSLSTTFALVPIDGSATSVDVTTTAASTDLVITFDAECQGPESGGAWVDVDVKVDGTTLGATDNAGGDAFCTGQYEFHGVTVAALDLGPGVHTVTVEALETSESGSWLDDTGLTILAVED